MRNSFVIFWLPCAVIAALLVLWDPFNVIEWNGAGESPQIRLRPDQFAKQVQGELCAESIERLQLRLDGLTEDLSYISSDVTNLVRVSTSCLQRRRLQLAMICVT